MLACFGLASLDDKWVVTQEFLRRHDVVGRVRATEPRLRPYYIPCKARIYLNNLTLKKCVTVLRQTLRLYDRLMVSHYSVRNGIKQLSYTLAHVDDFLDPRYSVDPGFHVVDFR